VWPSQATTSPVASVPVNQAPVDNRGSNYNADRYNYGNSGCYTGNYTGNSYLYNNGYNGYNNGCSSTGYNNGYYNGYNGYNRYGYNSRTCLSFDSRGVCTAYSNVAPIISYNTCAYANTSLLGTGGLAYYPGTTVPYSNYFGYQYGVGSQYCQAFPTSPYCPATNAAYGLGYAGYAGYAGIANYANCGYPVNNLPVYQNCVLNPALCVANVATLTLTAPTNPVAKNAIVPLTVTVACALATGINLGQNQVTVTDITSGVALNVGTVTTVGNIATVNWNTTNLGGTTRILQAASTGTCGTATQQFTLVVAA